MLEKPAADGGTQAPLYAPVAPTQRPLRIVALVDRPGVPAWIGETLAAIAEGDSTELVAVVIVAAPTAPRYPRVLETYLRLEARFAAGARVATDPCALAARLPAVTLLDGQGSEEHGSLVLPHNTLDTLRALDADLLVGFGLPPAGTELAAVARHGAWFFERHATDPLRAGLAYLAPIWRGEAVTPGGLFVHTHPGEGAQWLGRSWSATAQLSFSRNRAYQLLRIPAELARALRRLAAGVEPGREAAPLFAAPGTLAMCAFALRLCARALRRHLPRLGRVEHWILGLRREETRLDPEDPATASWRVLIPPAGCYWADPCLVRRGDRDYLFIEEYPYATRRGRIAVAELDQTLNATHVRTVLDEPTHLSYPQVFDWRGETWMLVESSDACRLPLYRALEFPLRWELVGDLLPGRTAVDGTLHFDGQRWFLFVNVTETPFGYDKRIWGDLFLFFADDPAGPWHPHPANPIVSDVRSARPAGALFMHEGRLIRPAQDCSVDYGYAVVFNEVTRLDREGYAEHPIGRLDPHWTPGLRGCHTYSSAGGIEVIDGKRLIPRAAARASGVAAPSPSTEP